MYVEDYTVVIYFPLAPGCFVTGLYLEGAGWSNKTHCLIKQRPKQLIQELPVLKIIPIESHRLKLQVSDRMKYSQACI